MRKAREKRERENQRMSMRMDLGLKENQRMSMRRDAHERKDLTGSTRDCEGTWFWMQQRMSVQNHLQLLRVRRVGRCEQRVCSVRPYYVLVDCILHVISEKSIGMVTASEQWHE